MEDLSEMSLVVRSRARAAIAKVSVPVLTGMPMCDDARTRKDCVHFQVRDYQGSFSSYRYLWTDDR